MHWSGKVFAFLTLAAALGGAVLTARLIEVRNSWARKADTSLKTIADLEPKLATAKAEADRVQGEINRAADLWGRTWSDVGTQVADPAQGNLAIEIGTNNGVNQGMWLYAFEPTADGSIYRGEFAASTVRENQALVTPTFRVRQNEIQQWQPGRWRWRSQLPAGYTAQERLQQRQLIALDERLADLQMTLQTHDKVLAEAQQQLARREAELLGGEQLSQDPNVAQEFREGLLAAIAVVEEERNATLLEVDSLRHELREQQRLLDGLQQENQALVGQLPQPATAVTSRPEGSRD